MSITFFMFNIHIILYVNQVDVQILSNIMGDN